MHTLGDIAKFTSDEFAHKLHKFMNEEYAEYETYWWWTYRYGSVTPAQLTEKFIQWLADQGVWRVRLKQIPL